MITPDACILMDFMLRRFTSIIQGLVVNPEKMKENLDLSRGTIFSGTLLVALVDHGMTREEAYKLVQAHAINANHGETLKERVLADSQITKIMSKKEIEDAFDIKRHLANVDFIFDRVFHHNENTSFHKA